MMKLENKTNQQKNYQSIKRKNLNNRKKNSNNLRKNNWKYNRLLRKPKKLNKLKRSLR